MTLLYKKFILEAEKTGETVTADDRYEAVWKFLSARGNSAEGVPSFPVFGFTSNLDIVLKWDADRFNALVKEHLREEPSFRPGDEMRTVEDFVRIACGCILQGAGGNFDVTDGTLCTFLRGAFETELSLGGTAVQGAAALGALGIPVNVHISDDSSEVCAFLDSPFVSFIRDGKKTGAKEKATDAEPVCHVILQYRKGDVLEIDGRAHEITQSNRLILFYDTMQKEVPFDESFFAYWESGKEHPSSLSFSGFDAVTDEAVIGKKIARMKTFLVRVKARTPSVISYLEGAFYMNPRVKTRLFCELAKHLDIISMNEEELAAQVARLDEKADLSDAQGVMRALGFVFRAFRANGIVLHTGHYAMYCGKRIAGADLADGLCAGNLMAATRARTGRYGTLADLKETLRVPLSESGTRMSEALQSLSVPEARALAGEGCEAIEEIAAVPARFLEKPAYTVGLGDTFAAGVHTCFL